MSGWLREYGRGRECLYIESEDLSSQALSNRKIISNSDKVCNAARGGRACQQKGKIVLNVELYDTILVEGFDNFQKLQLGKETFSYGEGPWGSRRMRKAVAKFMTKTMSAVETVRDDDVLVANGITTLCDMLATSIGDSGDGVLFSRPIYQAFKLDFLTNAKCARSGDTDVFCIG